jgi:hypothetical protein
VWRHDIWLLSHGRHCSGNAEHQAACCKARQSCPSVTVVAFPAGSVIFVAWCAAPRASSLGRLADALRDGIGTCEQRILSAAFVAGGIPQPPAGIAPVLSERKVWLLWQSAIGGGCFAEPLVRFDATAEGLGEPMPRRATLHRHLGARWRTCSARIGCRRSRQLSRLRLWSEVRLRPPNSCSSVSRRMRRCAEVPDTTRLLVRNRRKPAGQPGWSKTERWSGR